MNEKVNFISIKDFLEKKLSIEGAYFSKDEDYFILPFFKDGKPFTSPGSKKWGMTLLKASSMRFRWNEENLNRDIFFEKLTKNHSKNADCVVPLELIHSKKVFSIHSKEEIFNETGDGIISDNKDLIPSVTVADCVPIYFFDTKTNSFGIVHSGWKGTGIIQNAIELAVKNFNSKKEDICVSIGSHICQNCYFIDEERALYFTKNFGSCVKEVFENGEKKSLLSLTDANLFVLKNCGIKEENITVLKECTCCSTFSDNSNIFGSFRRQAAFRSETDLNKKSRLMCVQAAFVI